MGCMYLVYGCMGAGGVRRNSPATPHPGGVGVLGLCSPSLSGRALLATSAVQISLPLEKCLSVLDGCIAFADSMAYV